MTIGIIGLGYVGLTLAIAAAECGITVYGTEIDKHIKECLKKDQTHFYEPGLDDLVKKHNRVRFFCVDEFPAGAEFDAFIITVGTPLVKGAKQPDFEYIKSALQSIERVYDGGQLVILRSTVSVGTTRDVVMPFLAELCGKPESEILAAMCPERTVEGKAIEELTGLPQIISGNNARSIVIAEALFRKITNNIIIADSLEEAELAKLYNNVYRDTSFSLGNLFCMGAQKFGLDGTKVIKLANKDYSRSNIALPGFVAGPCLEKDTYLLANNMPECAEREFFLSARQYNESLEDIVVEWVEKRFDEKSANRTVALSGMAFKGTPETNDLRGSSSVYIAQKLRAKGFALKLHDFVTPPEELEALGLGVPCATVEDVCQDARLLLILNNHKGYKALEPSAAMERDDFEVLDAWDVCAKLRGSGQISIWTLGNIRIEKNASV